MGRFFGRRPDRTPAMARFLRSHLEPGERVIAGVDVETPGTAGAALEGGASGAVGAAVGNLPPAVGRDGGQRAAWLEEATAMGIDPSVAGSLVHCAVVLTSARLIVLRRSSLTRRLDRIAFAWPVEEVDRIEVPRGEHRLTISRLGQTLTFEIFRAPKFRPAIYGELPKLFDDVKARTR